VDLTYSLPSLLGRVICVTETKKESLYSYSMTKKHKESNMVRKSKKKAAKQKAWHTEKKAVMTRFTEQKNK
jgi:hypothetical protein